jgi:putative acetyltransferase
MPLPRLELAYPGDATAILAVREAAIHGTAAQLYGTEVAADWVSRRGPDTDRELAERIATGVEVAIVARISGRIVAFGSIEPASNELRALYTAPAHGRRGIGSLILAELEAQARRLGMAELHMDATLNAEDLYRRHGYAALVRGEQPLPSGRTMTCVRMRKLL